MARGLPAVWSTLLGAPLLGIGVYLAVGDTSYPPSFGVPYLLFGGFVVVLGLYIHFVAAPDKPRMSEDEEIIDTRHPVQRASFVKIGIGLPLLLLATYLYFFTIQPYVYPTLALVAGLYLFSTGLQTYWANSLTTYYLTNDRVIKEYRLVSLVRQEIQLSKVRGVEERKSLIESLVGLGNVRVSTGGGGSLQVVVSNIQMSTTFADEIRSHL